MVGTLEGFADIWGISYLMTTKGLTTKEASSITSFIFVGMLFGGPILAHFAEKFKFFFGITMLCAIAMAFLLLSILFFNNFLPLWFLRVIMFSIGILCCYQVIVFSIGATMVPPYLIGITVAFLNCINMLGGSFFHSLIGRLMDYFEPAKIVYEGGLSYSMETYTYALTLIPIASLIGAALVGWSKFVQENTVKIKNNVMLSSL
jgi:MFS family permease